MEARPSSPAGSGERERESNQPPSVPGHELLRCIGQGSYGEVWLARNILGAFRAVKIVYRRNFDHDRPFEREFAGIRNFEPISRSHEGFVDLLQVGRDDARACLYYVMELADQAEHGPNVGQGSSTPAHAESPPAKREAAPPAGILPARRLNADTYISRTLRSEIQQRGRLPLSECVELGLSLTSAVAFLHQRGLVHRDIKPSNIVFVDGQPKLADVGLVAGANEARSFVGTEGFIPPEGPGAPQADLYSLGIVLYQTSTGKSHQAFPEPLEDLISQPDHARWLEFNTVIHKACATNARERYQSAEEMLAELELLQRGQSVKRKRVAERRVAVAKKLLFAAAIGALFATGASLLSIRFNDSTVQRFDGSIPVEANSIAVLPFVNESKGEAHEHLNRALGDEMMNALTNIAGLRVAPRHAVLPFKGTNQDLREIGGRLDVRTILAGNFKKASNQLYIAARLIDATDGTELWSAAYDRYRRSTNIVEIASQIVSNVAEVLTLSLPQTGLRQMESGLLHKLAAYRLYSQAMTNWWNTQAGLDRSIRFLNQAIAEDENFAQAYATLARCYVEASAFYLPQAQAMAAAKINALRALQLDDTLQMAHLAMALVSCAHDLDKGETHFRRAIEIAPNNGRAYGEYAIALSQFGRFNQADEVLNRGEQVDPTDDMLLSGWCWRYYLTRDFEDARQAANRLLAVHPHSIIGPWFLAFAHEGMRQYDQALIMAEKTFQQDSSPDGIALIGRIHARLGHRQEAEKALAEIRVLAQSPGGERTFLAEVLFALGETNRALEHLQRAVEEYPPIVQSLKVSPFWDDLRVDPRFVELLKKVELEK